ncbi:hypothetical protein SUDANB6_01201 [Streptomyces sp. enrichment culture]
MLRRGHDTADVNMHSCSEHLSDPVQAEPAVPGTRRVAQQAAGEAGWSGRIMPAGPKFRGHHTGGFPRVRRDRSEGPLDPGVVRARRPTAVCLLDGATHHGAPPAVGEGHPMATGPVGHRALACPAHLPVTGRPGRPSP